MSEPSPAPLEIVGDAEVGVCVDGVCVVPESALGGADHSEGDVVPDPEA